MESNHIKIFDYQEPTFRGSIHITYDKKRDEYTIEVKEMIGDDRVNSIVQLPYDVWRKLIIAEWEVLK